MKVTISHDSHNCPDDRREPPIVRDGQVLVRPGTLVDDHDLRPAAKVVAPLREVQDQEKKLEAEIAQRSAQLEAARAAALEIQVAFDAAVSRRNQERANLAGFTGELEVSLARMAELQSWILAYFNKGRPTVEQFGEYYRRSMMALWMPDMIRETKERLALAEAELAELARRNDLQVPD